MRYLLTTQLLLLSLLIFSVNIQAQQSSVDQEVLSLQEMVTNTLLKEKKTLETDCARIRRYMSSKDDGIQYLECATERLERALVAWGDGLKNFLEEIRQFMEPQFQQALSSQGPEAGANGISYMHGRIKNYHVQLVTMSQTMFQHNLISRANLEDILENLQNSMNQQTERARRAVNQLQGLEQGEASEAEEIVSTWFEESFSSLYTVTRDLQVKVNKEIQRLRTQYPVDFDRRPDRFQEVVNLYHDTITTSLNALISQSKSMWVTQPKP